MPSVAASFIERLPDEGDPQRSREEKIAKNVVFVAYAGVVSTFNLGRLTDFFIAPAGPHLSWL